jgi:chitosanase
VSAIVNIFETGRIRGDYGAIAVLKGDTGHLSYGRSQTTLGSGGLFRLLDTYCQAPGAKFAAQLKPLLPQFQQRDPQLDSDAAVHAILKQAGQDPVMRVTQDQFFYAHYLAPACLAAESLKVMLPLGQAVVYDSHVQGGWAKLKARVGAVGSGGEKEWVKNYVALRKNWLLSLNPPVPNTVYRMDSFNALIEKEKWDLALPLTVHGVMVTEEALAGDSPTPGSQKRILRLTTPYLRGEDVRALQQALKQKGFNNSADGIYGPFTHALVRAWQKQQSIQEDVVGPETRGSLGL